MVNNTATPVFEGKYQRRTIPSRATLEMYKEMPIFVPIDITEEALEQVARNILGSSVPERMDSGALQKWLLKFEEDSTRLHTSVETFVDWKANGSPPWAAYWAFMSDRLIVLDKQPGVRPVGVGEMWRRLFAKILLTVTGPEATMACQDDQIFAGLKAGIDGANHIVQDI